MTAFTLPVHMQLCSGALAKLAFPTKSPSGSLPFLSPPKFVQEAGQWSVRPWLGGLITIVVMTLYLPTWAMFRVV